MTAFVARRELLLGLAALPVASRIAVAETYPSRPVRILVATSAGGGTDLVARFIAQWLTERLGQSFFVENRPGGGNNIGTEMAARSPRGRLYAVHGEHGQHHQQFALSEAQLQLHRRLRAGRERHGHAAARSRASVGSGKKCRRTDRARQGQPRQAQPRLGRRRLDRSHVRRAVPDDGRHQVHPCAVSRRGARAHRSDRRPGAVDGFDHRLVDAVCQGRHSARARDDDRRPLWPNCPMCRRCRRRCRAIGPTPGAASVRRKERLRRSSPCSTRR